MKKVNLDDLIEQIKKNVEQRIEGEKKIKKWEIYKTKLDEYHCELGKKNLKELNKYKGYCYCHICILDIIG